MITNRIRNKTHKECLYTKKGNNEHAQNDYMEMGNAININTNQNHHRHVTLYIN
jgi:hypothetical protein